ncbi:MAG TPA: M48 family metalloprotease, partial [Paracoccaceae bacterium]|nr:M48 family metalloprotease [Paracoccaceae bacterium]
MLRTTRFFRMKPAVLALAASLAFAGCEPTAQNTPQSIAAERQQAQQLVSQLRAQNALVEDSGLNSYVRGIVQRVAATRGPGSVPIQSYIIKDADVNAFTPGGGYLFVNAGLIAAMENEAQLATVLAHEIGHIDRGHIQAGQARRAGVGLGAAAAMLGGALLGVDPQLTEFGVRLGSQYAVSSFTREQERDADLTAGSYLAEAGYNVAEGANSFGVLRRIAGGPGGGFLSSHPPTGERQQAMIAMASRLGATAGRV